MKPIDEFLEKTKIIINLLKNEKKDEALECFEKLHKEIKVANLENDLIILFAKIDDYLKEFANTRIDDLANEYNDVVYKIKKKAIHE